MTTPRQSLIVEACDDTLLIPIPPHLRHRRLAVTLEALDEATQGSRPMPNRDPEHIKQVLAEAWGAWMRPAPKHSTASVSASRPSPQTIKRVLDQTRGSWGNRSADEIDRMIEESRRSDCCETWLECGEAQRTTAEASDSTSADP